MSSWSNSVSSSAVASWYCWYSDTRSFTLLSASLNSISSIPSPVYQCKKALRLNIAVNCSDILLNSSWMAVVRNITYSCLNIVGDPFHEEAAVLVLNGEHLLVDLLHGHAATEDGGHGEVAAVAGVARRHHVLGVEHLLGELGHGEGAVLLAAAGCQGSEAGHEEVKTGERHHVDCQLAEIRIQLTREPQTRRHAGHGERHQVVQVSVRGVRNFEGSIANIVESFVVYAGSTTVSDTLGEGTTEYVFMILSGYSSLILEMSSVPMPEPVPPPSDTLGVVSLGPVVAGAGLAEHEVVRPEELPVRAGPHCVHCAGLEVEQDGAGDVLAPVLRRRNCGQ
ncbi:hypothetical protein SFRURICE_011147 [Spodoptera frugiperda]|nr:hypothetical protein SFRURICE_011147 [Spodoptera frugiperda]